MPDHRFPLQMEALALAVQSTGIIPIADKTTEAEITGAILRRASMFLGWAQSTTPTKERNPALRPHLANPLADPLESPVR